MARGNRRTPWIGLLCVLVWGCGTGGAGSRAGDLLRIGWAGSPDTMNPGTAVLAEAYTIFDLVYDALFRWELDGSLQPELAQSWTVSEDGRVWTFRIRPGVRFHDGQPLTAGDVAFSFRLYHEHPEFPFLNPYTRPFAGVRALDDHTVEIRLWAPVPNMESRLVFLFVLPEHVWAAHAQGAAAASFDNAAAVGSGPFRLVEHRQSEYVHVAANLEHWLSPPRVEGVLFQTYANQDALVQAVRTGQVDAITEMPYPAARALRREPHVQVTSGVPMPPGVTDILLNQLDPAHCPEGAVCSGHPALRDRRVRLALAHATDKAQLIDVALLGLGFPGLTLIPDSLEPWYNSALQDWALDVERAARILEEAGYRDTDADGVRELPGGGRPLILRLNLPADNTVSPRMAQILARMWARIGVRALVRPLDPDALTAACCPAFDYDVILWGWDSDPDPNLLLGAMTGEQIPTGANETGYASPEYDSLYQEQARELDPERRRELVWRMQGVVHRDVVYIVPYYERLLQAYRTDRYRGWVTDAPRVALQHPTSLTRVEPVR
ncbi:MAG: ABC transporter substrate-binding protein [Candidatus Latescibacterota bacterium]